MKEKNMCLSDYIVLFAAAVVFVSTEPKEYQAKKYLGPNRFFYSFQALKSANRHFWPK